MRTATLPAAKQQSRHSQQKFGGIVHYSGNVYYYRDGYVDQQIAFGVARSARNLRFNTPSRTKKLASGLTQLAFAAGFLCAAFVVTYVMLDALGLDHLTQIGGGDRLVYDWNRLVAANL